MRWLRLLLLGLASVYPLYWTAQFVLFFLPESLVGFWLGEPVRVVSISYLQATSVVTPHAVFPAHWEALAFALLSTFLILGLRGDRFLTGAFAVVILGQSALLPFASHWISTRNLVPEFVAGGSAAFALIVFGLFRILQQIGGSDFLDRLALLSLLAVLPQAGLWLAFRAAYPFFGTRFLLMLLVPLYLAAIVAAILPSNLADPVFSGVPWMEILASSAAAGLLILAIALSSHSSLSLSSRLRTDGTNGYSLPSAGAVYPLACGNCQ
jgi:hypothetical protein